VRVHLSVLRVEKSDCYSGRHVCVHCTFKNVSTCLSYVCFIAVSLCTPVDKNLSWL